MLLQRKNCAAYFSLRINLTEETISVGQCESALIFMKNLMILLDIYVKERKSLFLNIWQHVQIFYFCQIPQFQPPSGGLAGTNKLKR